MSNNKTSNFLSAIEKYSEQERQAVIKEAQEKRAEALRKAEVKGKADAEKYVSKLLAAASSEVTSEYAVKSLEAQGEIFKKREAMIQEIFSKAHDKLLAFTESAEYRDKLLSYAEEIADKFNNKKCVIYLKSGDMKYANDVQAVFNSDTEIKEDVKILIGGLRAYCEELKLVADNTLDSKLEEQKKWFVENADLKL